MADNNDTPLNIFKCQCCGIESIAKRKNKKFCGKKCNDYFRNNTPKYFSICAVCNKEFKAKRTNYMTCCSRECGFKYLSNQRNLIRNDLVTKEKKALRKISKAKHTKFKSINVLKEIAALVRIKNKNKRQYGTLNKKTYGRCQCCFNLFVFTIKMGSYKTLCSDKCRKQKYKERKKVARKKLRSSGFRKDKDRNHRKRARHYGVKYEPINVFKVFDRDMWKCHICGIKTPKDKRGTIELNAPELDHIITFAEGGSHTYNNVACCCRKCNIAKGGKSKGQMFLFGKI